jgi:excisionase family DNA binding protein
VTARERLEHVLGPATAGLVVELVREVLAEEAATSTASDSRGYCSVAEAAETLGVSTRQVYRQVHAGTLEHKRVGERVVIPRRALR